jgi:citrate/tricarballylate utilization protein
MEIRRSFFDDDLNYLANLCHSCGACYTDCPFSPPHEFNVNVPKVLARVRADSYSTYVWPRFLAGAFAHNALFVTIATAASISVFVLALAVAFRPDGTSFVTSDPADFYRAAFLYAILAFAMGVRRFWRRSGAAPANRVGWAPLWQALKNAASLRYLGGGGDGCADSVDRTTDWRRLFHHLTFYGFALCFAATSVATVYHYVFGREAPYPWWDLPVLLGAVGGIGLVIGPAGLLAAKMRRDPALADRKSLRMDLAFIGFLFLTGSSGLLLLVLRHSHAMPVLLAVHLGVVLSLFLTMPYGKFVHGVYRYVALVRYAQEQQS